MVEGKAVHFAAEFEPALADGRRRSARAPVSLDAEIGRGGLDRTLCRVVDLSAHGVRVQTYSALRPGTLIWLTLPRLAPRAARVSWASDFLAGLELCKPLDESEFAALTA